MLLRPVRRLTAALAVAVTTVGLGAGLVGGPAQAAGSGTITVPDDFVPALSDTRATGSYEVVGTGLRVTTQGSTSTDKVAEYVATATPLAEVGEPSLELTNNGSGTIPPGFQLVVDFDGNGSPDGILVGEEVYGGEWWLTNGSAAFVKAGAPAVGGGFGSPYHGTLDQWRSSFPAAQVQAFGFSLGSGVKGDWTIDAIDVAGTRYTFRTAVRLTSAEECKQGGWASSTAPVFRNQGDCVSSFASSARR